MLTTGTLTFLFTDIEGSTVCWAMQPSKQRSTSIGARSGR